MSRSEVASRNAWSAWLDRRSARIERALDAMLPPASDKPPEIHRAMRYSVFPGGKRVRPGLAQLGFEVAGGRGDSGLLLGAAIELLHTFSLIHDDLPCMDDDDYRRGRPSCHQVFGDAIAVLAGDALQVLAFRTLARMRARPAARVRVIDEITDAVGTGGVIGGQVDDILSEGKRISPQALRSIHSRKTGALLRCALVSGGRLGGARRALLDRLERFGDAFGILFQVVDDLLNEVGSYEVLGRKKGGDRLRGKATYPSILGLERTRTQLGRSFAECRRTIPVADGRAAVFEGLLVAVVARLPVGWSGPLLDGRGPR
jgi:geranylgeranyl diphosphate synthase type II